MIKDGRPNFLTDEYCRLYPRGYLTCGNYHCCGGCEVADRYREGIGKSAPLFGYRAALPRTGRGCMNFIGKPLILTPEAMERLGIELLLINQIVLPEPSPGCFPQNPCGFIDCRLFTDRKRSFTVTRNEVFGVPTPDAAARFDKIFFLNLSRYLK